MALSSGQKICYAIILILTILLAGLIFATAAKGYHYNSEDSNFRNKNDFGYGNYFRRLQQQTTDPVLVQPVIVQPITPGQTTQQIVVQPGQQVAVQPGQQVVVQPGQTFQQVVQPGQQVVVQPGQTFQQVVQPGQQVLVQPAQIIQGNIQAGVQGVVTQLAGVNATINRAIVADTRTFINGTNTQTYVAGYGPYVTLPDGRQVQRNYLTAH